MAIREQIRYKSRREMDKLREAGRLAANALRVAARAAKPGVTLLELDKLAETYIRKQGVLRDGDIVAIDCGAKLDGFHGDTCLSVGVGQISDQAKELLRATQLAMFMGIDFCRTGYRLGDMASAVQRFGEERGYSIVREYIGHGIGRDLHEDPQVVYADQRPGTGFRMEVGMTITIEPIFNLGTQRCLVEPDGWTVRTADGSLSAQYEHAVAITKDGPMILSLPDPEFELEDGI